MEFEIKNAIIESAEIKIEENGILSAWLYLDYGGSGQGFGGYVLYLPKSFTHYSFETSAGHFIYRILEIAGVEKWSALKGKTIRVEANYNGIKSIGHITNDDWFDMGKDIKENEGG